MKNNFIIILLASFLIISCSQQEDPKGEVEAFIVVGAGNGIPLAGREVISIKKSFIPALVKLREKFLQEKEALLKDALAQNPSINKKINEYTASMLKNDDQIKNVNNEIVKISSMDLGDFSKQRELALKPLFQEEEKLNNTLNNVKEIQKEFLKRVEMNIQSISAYQQELNEVKLSIDNYIVALNIPIRNYVVNKELGIKVPVITTNNISIIKNSRNYLRNYRMLVPKHKTTFVEIDNLSELIGINISSEIDPILHKVYNSLERLTQINSFIANEEDQGMKDAMNIANKYPNKFKPLNLRLYKSINGFQIYMDEIIKNTSSDLKDISIEKKEINSSTFINKIKSTMIEKEKKKISLLEELTSNYKELIQASKKVAILSSEAVLEEKLQNDIFIEILLHKSESSYTDLNGSVRVPKTSDYIFMRANRLSDERYSWLIKPNFKSGKQILSNHNISSNTTSLGSWVFEVLSNDINNYNLKNKTSVS